MSDLHSDYNDQHILSVNSLSSSNFGFLEPFKPFIRNSGSKHKIEIIDICFLGGILLTFRWINETIANNFNSNYFIGSLLQHLHWVHILKHRNKHLLFRNFLLNIFTDFVQNIWEIFHWWCWRNSKNLDDLHFACAYVGWIHCHEDKNWVNNFESSNWDLIVYLHFAFEKEWK